MKIVIDIGHANGTGARGNGLEEHEVAARIASCLEATLGEDDHDVHVLDYPELSNSADLNKTIIKANEIAPDIGVSLHCDCSDNASAHGAHVCYYPSSADGKRLAEAIATPLAILLPGRAEIIQPRSDLAVLRRTNAPWVLCECGFISHAGDAQMMAEHPDEIARAIFIGITTYINNQQ